MATYAPKDCADCGARFMPVSHNNVYCESCRDARKEAAEQREAERLANRHEARRLRDERIQQAATRGPQWVTTSANVLPDGYRNLWEASDGQQHVAACPAIVRQTCATETRVVAGTFCGGEMRAALDVKYPGFTYQGVLMPGETRLNPGFYLAQPHDAGDVIAWL